ncbi:hypothetical protein G647_06231 [Cladophialophora carrionii CBS 160.54]|uniref:Uncharacterized protein n=1 Tax=Cladophialophora carrionii CBS 160.54 TaxID=1279043 RepID=V9D791_9EURO|nr:uncharacterized protein G647_06231 [Cladophialophora carrionii CBS 160.54]ETI22158.1 hypothetical protein G647_06231 [Cladophialophora carrionii CBS 160.54]
MHTPATVDSMACAASTIVDPPTADEERDRMIASSGARVCRQRDNVTANTNMTVAETGVVVKAMTDEKAGVVHSATMDDEDMEAASVAGSFSLQDDYIPL